MPRPAIIVHYLDSDGTIACKGIDLATAACRLGDGPPRITIREDDVTCEICRRWFMRIKLAS